MSFLLTEFLRAFSPARAAVFSPCTLELDSHQWSLHRLFRSVFFCSCLNRSISPWMVRCEKSASEQWTQFGELFMETERERKKSSLSLFKNDDDTLHEWWYISSIITDFQRERVTIFLPSLPLRAREMSSTLLRFGWWMRLKCWGVELEEVSHLSYNFRPFRKHLREDWTGWFGGWVLF